MPRELKREVVLASEELKDAGIYISVQILVLIGKQ